MDEITSKSAVGLAQLMRNRTLSPVDVMSAYLQHIEELNPKLNAIVTFAEDLIDKAKEAEIKLARGGPVGALHGLPITIKDTIDTAGLKTTSGSIMREHFVPEVDAPSVARLKAAGAIIIGKTNAAEMAMDYTAENPVFGRTLNPYELSCSPGGSSGGEAVAITTCMSPAGLGSDLAGSIRIPCHFCGIVGLKPTTGRVPSAGQFPASIGPYSLGAAIGPMARTVEDLLLLFNVLAGLPGSSLDHCRQEISGWRCAWYTDDGVAPVTAETRTAVEAAARALSKAGLIVEEILPPCVNRGHELWLKLFSRASVVLLRELYTGNEDKAGEFVRWRLATADNGLLPTLDEYISNWMERDRLRAKLVEWMENWPLVIAPVGSVPALEHDVVKVTVMGRTMSAFRAFSYSQTFNVFDLPSVCVPVTRSAAGLPIGVQIVGRPFAEESTLAAAAIVEEALAGWRAPGMLGGV